MVSLNARSLSRAQKFGRRLRLFGSAGMISGISLFAVTAVSTANPGYAQTSPSTTTAPAGGGGPAQVALTVTVDLSPSSTQYSLNQSVTLVNNSGTGPINEIEDVWRLYGPITPGAGNSCANLNWASAAEVTQGTLILSTFTPATTQNIPITSVGCYSFGNQVGASNNTTAANTPVGASSDTTFVPQAAAGGSSDTST